MYYQNILNNIKTETDLNSHNYLEQEYRTNKNFDWFEITPQLKTKEGENTCLFYKLLLEDFDLSIKYLSDLIKSNPNNKNDFTQFYEAKNKLTPFIKANFARELTPTKKMVDMFNFDITLASSKEIEVKALFSEFYNGVDYLNSKFFYLTLDSLANQYLSLAQRKLINDTVQKIENYKSTTPQKQDWESKNYVIDYLSNPCLSVNNKLANMALLTPIFKAVLTHPQISTDDKKEILIKNKYLDSSDLREALVSLYANKVGENYQIKIALTNNSLLKELLDLIKINTMNQKILENKIELEKDYLSNLIVDTSQTIKKMKV